MVPFIDAIKNDADAIMVGHLLIKDVDKRYPASLSKRFIQKYLIEKYKYKGLIITDELKMLAIQLHYSEKKAVEKAIEAGNDIIMIGLSTNRIRKIIKYIIKKVQKGKIDIKRIEESAEKIISMKEKYNVNDGKVTGVNIEEINNEIEQLNKKIMS